MQNNKQFYGVISNDLKQYLVEMSAIIGDLPQEKQAYARYVLAGAFACAEQVHGLENMALPTPHTTIQIVKKH